MLHSLSAQTLQDVSQQTPRCSLQRIFVCVSEGDGETEPVNDVEGKAPGVYAGNTHGGASTAQLRFCLYMYSEQQFSAIAKLKLPSLSSPQNSFAQTAQDCSQHTPLSILHILSSDPDGHGTSVSLSTSGSKGVSVSVSFSSLGTDDVGVTVELASASSNPPSLVGCVGVMNGDSEARTVTDSSVVSTGVSEVLTG